MTPFDPEGTFTKEASIFGMPRENKNSAQLALLPCPWEPTTSFKKGTALGPPSLFEASKQMDLYHPYFKKAYEKGVYWEDSSFKKIKELNERASSYCASVKHALENEREADSNKVEKANELSDTFNKIVYDTSIDFLNQGKTVGLVGGDHSTPYGLIQALNESQKEPFSIVHIDAHFDLRKAYQGFTHSHASIMYNVKTYLKNPPKLYQLGIRDFCESEYKFAQENSQFVLDQEFQKFKFEGQCMKDILENFFQDLSENIYISIDVDGLSPEFCPNTGTPVPGGLTFSETTQMIQHLHRKGHKLVGFDLVEAAPNIESSVLGEGLDETIAVRLLYDLSCFALS